MAETKYVWLLEAKVEGKWITIWTPFYPTPDRQVFICHVTRHGARMLMDSVKGELDFLKQHGQYTAYRLAKYARISHG